MSGGGLAGTRIGLVGPMLGHRAGWAPGPGEVLAELLEDAGLSAVTTSAQPRGPARLLDTALSLARWRGEVDAVVAMVFSGLGFAFADLAGLLARRLLRRPLVLWLHGGNLPAFAARRPRWTGRVLRRADRLVVPTLFLGEAFAELGPRISVIPNPLRLIDYPFRHRRHAAARLLWMRTFHPLYRPEMAVEALARLRRTAPDATLTMAGRDRGALAETRRRAAALGVAEAVRFAGFLDLAGKQQALASHDVFLNTNRVDNAPVSVIEAAAAGLPVVATDVGGMRHLVRHEESALLVADGDAAAMAAAVARLLAEPALAARLSAAGRQLAARCDAPLVRRHWLRLFAELGLGSATR